jgi:chromosome segregation ATPase
MKYKQALRIVRECDKLTESVKTLKDERAKMEGDLSTYDADTDKLRAVRSAHEDDLVRAEQAKDAALERHNEEMQALMRRHAVEVQAVDAAIAERREKVHAADAVVQAREPGKGELILSLKRKDKAIESVEREHTKLTKDYDAAKKMCVEIATREAERQAQVQVQQHINAEMERRHAVEVATSPIKINLRAHLSHPRPSYNRGSGKPPR